MASQRNSLKEVVCWLKGIGYGPGGHSWYSFWYTLKHPGSNSGKHDDEEVNVRVVETGRFFDLRCKYCGRVSADWQDVNEGNMMSVLAELANEVNAAGGEAIITTHTTEGEANQYE